MSYSNIALFVFNLFVGLILFSSCKSGISDKNYKEQVLVIIDSIRIDYNGHLTLVDISKSENSYLFYDDTQQTLLVTNKDGKTIAKITPLGEGPDKIGSHLSSLTFIDDNQLLLCSEQGYFYFDIINGVFLKRIPDNQSFSIDIALKIHSYIIEDTLTLIHKRKSVSDYLSSSQQQELKWGDFKYLTFFNTETHSSKVKIGLIDGELDDFEYYKKHRLLFRFLYDLKGDTLDVVINPKPILYRFDLKSSEPKLIHKTQLTPLDMSPTYYSDNHLSLTSNGHFEEILHSNNFSYISYKTDIDISIIKSFARDQLSNAYYNYYKQKIIVIDNTDQKKVGEYSLGYPLRSVLKTLSNGTLICSANHQLIEHKNHIFFYLTKIP